MSRRAPGAVVILAGMLLLAPGCRAHDARYWSFPLNSMQMVDNAVANDWSFGEALGIELLSQVFPWSWIESAVDLLMLPVTLVYDSVELVAGEDDSMPFEEQVARGKRRGIKSPELQKEPLRPGSPLEKTPEHLEPAEH